MRLVSTLTLCHPDDVQFVPTIGIFSLTDLILDEYHFALAVCVFLKISFSPYDLYYDNFFRYFFNNMCYMLNSNVNITRAN